MLKRLANGLGLLVGAAGVVFVVRELSRHRAEVLELASDANPLWLVLGLVVGLSAMTTIGLGWRRLLAILGHRTTVTDCLRRYFIGQLGKYVPGGIWPVLGRAEMARRGGAPGPAAYASTMLSLGLTYLAALLLAAMALMSGSGGGNVAWQPVVALLPLGLLIIHPKVLNLGLALLRRVTKRAIDVEPPSWTSSALLLIAHLPAWLAISAATWLVAYALGGSAPDFRNIAFATALSWFVGFVAVPVPGGIGVREAVFIAAATSVTPGLAAAVALVSRVLFILVDLTGAGATSLLPRAAGRQAQPVDSPTGEVGDGRST